MTQDFGLTLTIGHTHDEDNALFAMANGKTVPSEYGNESVRTFDRYLVMPRFVDPCLHGQQI